MAFAVVDMKATGKNIRRLRNEKGLSVEKLRELLGLASVQSIYKWERGASIPSTDNIIFLCAIFGVKMEELIVIAGKQAD